MKIYTAFVSSTYSDLVDERQRVAAALQTIRCLPLAMESFPSTGESQWVFIEESIELADFCIFIVAGRYGSIDPDSGISWTHREYREAIARRKRVIVMVHRNWRSLPAFTSESDPAKVAGLEAFHAELSGSGHNNVLYESLDELIGGIHRSVARLKEDTAVEGWVRPSDVRRFRIIYDLLTLVARYRPSTTVADALDLEYESHRVFRGRLPGGVARQPISWGRVNDNYLPFGPHNNARLTLISGTRSGPGEVQIVQRKQSSTSFVFDLEFSPALRYEERADVQFSARLDGFTYAFAEDHLAATRNSLDGARDFADWSWTPSRPITHFEMTVEVARSAVREVRGLTVQPKLTAWDERESAEVLRSATYSESTIQIDGVEFERMHVSVDNPAMSAEYMLSWWLPHRRE